MKNDGTINTSPSIDIGLVVKPQHIYDRWAAKKAATCDERFAFFMQKQFSVGRAGSESCECISIKMRFIAAHFTLPSELWCLHFTAYTIIFRNDVFFLRLSDTLSLRTSKTLKFMCDHISRSLDALKCHPHKIRFMHSSASTWKFDAILLRCGLLNVSATTTCHTLCTNGDVTRYLRHSVI